MASFNVTGDDSSPLITYSPANAWADSAGGANINSYFWSSYHQTSAKGASATIAFNGTGIWLFGSRNSSFGDYSISVDGGKAVTNSGSGSQRQFQTMLGGTGGLKHGPHTIILTNTGSLLDLDAFIIESEVGSVGSTISNYTVDDTDPKFKYGPTPITWQTPSDPASFNKTQHVSSTAGATASYSFKGNAIGVYGNLAPGNGVMTLALDGVTKTIDTGASRVQHPQALLFWQDSLGSQDHQLTITNQNGKPVNIDALQVYTASSGSGATGGSGENVIAVQGNPTSTGHPSLQSSVSGAAGPKSSKTSNKPAAGMIVGGILGVFVFLALIGLFLILFLRRRGRGRQSAVSPQPTTPTLPWQTEKGGEGYMTSGPAPAQAPRLYMPSTPPVPMLQRGDSTASTYSRYSETSQDGLLGEKDNRTSPSAASGRTSTQSSKPARPARPPTLKFPTGLRR